MCLRMEFTGEEAWKTHERKNNVEVIFVLLSDFMPDYLLKILQ